MSKVNKKYTVAIKGIIHIDDDVISIENEETGEIIPISQFIGDFTGQECTMNIAYAEDFE